MRDIEKGIVFIAFLIFALGAAIGSLGLSCYENFSLSIKITPKYSTSTSTITEKE